MGNKLIKIKSFSGIGDLLLLTPTLRVIKETYPSSHIIVNTTHPNLLKNNPFIDQINYDKDGLYLGYPDPIHCKNPTKHHILSDWGIVCKAFNLATKPPELKPEIYIKGIRQAPDRKHIGVQVMHKGQWHRKKEWPWFKDLIGRNPSLFTAIPTCRTVEILAVTLSSYKVVVCSEGGISHLTKAIGIPTVVIYGGFAKPEWNGYDNQVNMCNPLECSYCYNSYPCKNEVERKCLRDITISQVYNKVDRLMWSNYFIDI